VRVRIAIVLTCALVLLPLSVRNASAQGSSGEWRSYGADLASTKYSPLDQITAENFSQLEVAWRWKSADGFLCLDLPAGRWCGSAATVFEAVLEDDPQRWSRGLAPRIYNLKATPVMAGGVLFLSTPLYQAAAIDAGTGKTLWVHDPGSWLAGSPTNVNGFNSRGASYWSDGDDGRVFWGTGDGYLVCVDATTGEACAGFGVEGKADLTAGIPRADRGTRDFKNRFLLSVTAPPLVVGDVVLVSTSISDDRMRKESPPGWMRAFDVRTGEVLWTFHTVPQAGEPGVETWEGDSWRYSGNTNVWTQMSADTELGYVYLPIGTATSDYHGAARLGDNLFAESLVCLDAKTGERAWHFQFVHHGLWDYDLPAAPNLVDITVDGRAIKAVAQVTKQGFCFVFDRVTGEPVWPIEERAVAGATMPGEVASATQPFPTRPAPFEYQGVTLDDLIDFTPELRREALEAIRTVKIGPLYTPPSLGVEGGTVGTIQRPGIGGGANWWGAAVDPETGWLYVPSRNSSTVITFRENAGADDATLPFTHLYGGGPRMPSELPLFKPPYSRMTAIDLNTGDHRWMVPDGDGNRYRNDEALQQLELPPLGGDTSAGPLLTRTLLISAQSAGGMDDGPRLVARNKATGALSGFVDLPRRAIGTPMTYRYDGAQYIALTIQGEPPELIGLRLP